MRSCEYLETPNKQKQRTKTVKIGNIVFKKGNKTIPHSSSQLGKADLVRMKFKFMKNQDRDIWFHMFTKSNAILNPVIAWAYTVKRIRK